MEEERKRGGGKEGTEQERRKREKRRAKREVKQEQISLTWNTPTQLHGVSHHAQILLIVFFFLQMF